MNPWRDPRATLLQNRVNRRAKRAQLRDAYLTELACRTAYDSPDVVAHRCPRCGQLPGNAAGWPVSGPVRAEQSALDLWDGSGVL